MKSDHVIPQEHTLRVINSHLTHRRGWVSFCLVEHYCPGQCCTFWPSPMIGVHCERRRERGERRGGGERGEKGGEEVREGIRCGKVEKGKRAREWGWVSLSKKDVRSSLMGYAPPLDQLRLVPCALLQGTLGLALDKFPKASQALIGALTMLLHWHPAFHLYHTHMHARTHACRLHTHTTHFQGSKTGSHAEIFLL